MKTIRWSMLILVLGFVICSCQGTEKSQPELLKIDSVENFDTFNIRFHADSTFQLSRISFPLVGHFTDGESKHESWTVSNWVMLKSPVRQSVDTKEYRHSFIKTDSSVIEKFWIHSSGFKVERRFSLVGKKWFLVFYDDINL